MADQKLMQMELALRRQQAALAELIEIALHGIRESHDTSVAAMHMQARLQALAQALPRSLRQSRSATETSSIGSRRAS